jgi:Fe-S-cluster containining protein
LTRVLSFHAGYACRSSGACCCSGWPIPVEPETRVFLAEGLRSRRFEAPPHSRHGALFRGNALAFDAQGRCAFFEGEPGRLCSIQRQLGHAALPAACRHFPRVALIASAAVKLTLSHYCPTAAGLLFEAHAPATIVEDPPAFPATRGYEGLDVREALPPLLRPGVLMSHASYERFERHAVETLTGEGVAPESALRQLSACVEQVRRWTPGRGRFDDWLEQALHTATDEQDDPEPEKLWADVAAAVPPGLGAPILPARWRELHAAWVAPSWSRYAPVVGRYLAARAFASWCAFQGDGLRSTLRAVSAALAVLQIECARSCGGAQGPLDAALLEEAIRRSDLLLCHLVEPDRLARRLSAAERAATVARA